MDATPFIRTRAFAATMLVLFAIDSGTAAQSSYDKVLAEIEQKTGLKTVEIPGPQGAYLGKTHRYNIMDDLADIADAIPPQGEK